MEITAKLKERFCKDCKIPINIFEEPYFTYRINLYHNMYDSLNKYNLFVTELSKYKNEQDYLEEYNRIKDNAINDIKASGAYQRFNNEDMNKFAVNHKNMPGKDIFKPSFDGKVFISIDMVKANFNGLRHYSLDIFGGAQTWEEFISKYTENKHIINSKYIRQVILGNCNPKRHITYEKHLMDKVLDIIGVDNVVFFSNDEIVISVDSMESGADYKKNLEDALKEFDVPLRFELFTLHKIKGTDGYYKKKDDGSIELKCMDSFIIPFVLRKIYNHKVMYTDKVFYYQGLKSLVLEVPNIEL